MLIVDKGEAVKITKHGVKVIVGAENIEKEVKKQRARQEALISIIKSKR